MDRRPEASMFAAVATIPGEPDLARECVRRCSLRILKEEDISKVTAGSTAGGLHMLQVTVPGRKQSTHLGSSHEIHFRMDPSGEYAVRVQLKHFHDAF